MIIYFVVLQRLTGLSVAPPAETSFELPFSLLMFRFLLVIVALFLLVLCARLLQKLYLSPAWLYPGLLLFFVLVSWVLFKTKGKLFNEID
jgi:hypothetical protein